MEISSAFPAGMFSFAAQRWLTTASRNGAWNGGVNAAKAPMCRRSDVVGVAQLDVSSLTASVSRSTGRSPSSPSATRSHTAFICAVPAGVNRRNVSGFTAA